MLLRNPVERAISNYKHNIYLGKYRPNTTIEEVIENEMKFINHEKEKMMKNKNYYSRKFKYFSILDRGIYHKQLKIYFDNFDKKQIHVLFSENLFLNTRKEFLKKIDEFKNKYKDTNNVPRPKNWSGWCLNPRTFEFWLGDKYRIHERLKYNKISNKWKKEILYP